MLEPIQRADISLHGYTETTADCGPNVLNDVRGAMELLLR